MFNLYFILFSWHIIYSPLSISLTHTHTFKKKKKKLTHYEQPGVIFWDSHRLRYFYAHTRTVTHIHTKSSQWHRNLLGDLQLHPCTSFPPPPLPTSPCLTTSVQSCNAARVHLSPLSSLSPTFSSFPSLPTTSRWLKLFLWFYLPSLAHRQSFPSSCLCHFYFLLNCCRFSFPIGKYLC